MKFSAQEEYGLRCLIAIALKGEDGFLTIPEISRKEGLTASHVAKLLAILRKAGFIRSTRGQLGGYTLGRHPADIPLKHVLECLGGRMFSTGFCERHAGLEAECVHESDCLLSPLWSSIQAAVDNVVNRYTLEDVLESRIPEPLIPLSPKFRRYEVQAR